jgi:putative transcription antitermination factor YqgF
MDYGERRIGMAFKAQGEYSVFPLPNMKNQNDVLKRLVLLLKEKEANLLLVGYPLHLNGRKSQFTQKVEIFLEQLRNCLPSSVKLEIIDEAWSSQEAIQRLRNMGKNDSFIEKNKDAYSAVILLERFLQKQ